MQDYFMLNNHKMPSHWRWLLSDKIKKLSFPKEARASCSNCPSQLNNYTHPARCCTYSPQLTNFLIGSALKNQAISDKKFSSLLNMGTFLPLASLTTPEAMENKPEEPNVCHYWKQGIGCTIHKFRNHACSTFFCFTLAGPNHSLWSDLAEYVMMLENNLGWWLLNETGFDVVMFLNKLKTLDSNSKNKLTWNEQDLKYIWEHWYGKETKFFQKCADLVEKNKDKLYQIATSFYQYTTLGFQNVLATYPGYPEDTHLPATHEAIIAGEKKILSAINILNQASEILENNPRLSAQAAFKSPNEVSYLKNFYPEAAKFLVLTNSQEELIDFQPLKKEELKILNSLLTNRNSLNRLNDADKKIVSHVIAGLNLRGFLSNYKQI